MTSMEKQNRARSVEIVGADDGGASFAYDLLQSGTAESIVLLDVRQYLAEGQVLDLAHGLPFVPATVVRAGSPDDYTDAAVIVITAGGTLCRRKERQRSGEVRDEVHSPTVQRIGWLCLQGGCVHGAPAMDYRWTIRCE